MSTPVDKPRLMQLDILRAIAVVLVFGRHAVIQPYEAHHLKPLAETWYRLGWTGVDLFFVLSGFLIGGLLFKELRDRSRLDVGRFLVRRGLKIWPAYLVCVTATFVFLIVSLHDVWRAVSVVWANYLHIQNYRDPSVLRLLPHTWSLAVEEHFYLVLPGLLVLLTSTHRGGPLRRIPRFVAVAVGVLLACLLMRLVTQWYGLMKPTSIRWATHLRMDSLFMGVLLAYFHHFHPEKLLAVARHRVALLSVAVVMLAPFAYLKENDAFVVTIGFTMISIGYACLMLATVYTPSTTLLFRNPAARLVAYVGSYSYSIFLWHVLLAATPLRTIAGYFALSILGDEGRWVWFMGWYVVIACGVGMVLGALIEWPVLRWRDRFYPSRAETLVVVPTASPLLAPAPVSPH